MSLLQRNQITDAIALESLRSTICPACGGWKKNRQSLCPNCYRRLPRPMQQALYANFFEGYVNELYKALKHLNAQTFHTAPLKPKERPPQ